MCAIALTTRSSSLSSCLYWLSWHVLHDGRASHEEGVRTLWNGVGRVVDVELGRYCQIWYARQLMWARQTMNDCHMADEQLAGVQINRVKAEARRSGT